MRQRFAAVLAAVRTQVQLTRGRRHRADTRQRAIRWLRDKEHQRTPAPEAPPQQPNASLAQAPHKRARRGRARQPQDTLEKLLHTDATSQTYAEQLWWKFTTYYLPAKRLDIQRRRGLVASGDAEHMDAASLEGDEGGQHHAE
jgi:hypothetical protein